MQSTIVNEIRKYASQFNVKIKRDVGHVMMWNYTDAFNPIREKSVQEFLDSN